MIFGASWTSTLSAGFSPLVSLISSNVLTPHGSGPDYKVCFETFIENCDQYIEKIKKIQQEAREHMTILLEAAKELTHED